MSPLYNGMKLHRMLCCDFPLAVYRRFSYQRGLMHWGQLKLLLSEIEFLLRFQNQEYHVVYAGAAPGNHIKILLDLFPRLHFTLIDPNLIVIQPCDRVTVRHELMTELIAEEFSSRNDVLFISDVRTGPRLKQEPMHVHQERIHCDMTAQMRWYQAMRPECSLLKFRLPWSTHVTTEYLQGEIMLPVFGKFLTHETRLCVHGPDASVVPYDCLEYEGRMAYFNQFIRTSSMGGYDELRFRDIMSRYLNLTAEDLRVELMCSKLINDLHSACNYR